MLNSENEYVFTDKAWTGLVEGKTVFTDIDDIPSRLFLLSNGLTPSQNTVLKVLLKSCDRYGNIRYGVSHVAKASSVSRSVVYNNLQAMVNKRELITKSMGIATAFSFKKTIWAKMNPVNPQQVINKQISLVP